MTGPEQPVSSALQKARQRLLRLGLTDDHILSLPTPALEAFDSSRLDPLQADPHFNVIVQRVVRFLRGGRGLSIAITDDGNRGDARVHTAVQLAAGLTRHGIHVVVVDMDLQDPGLGGLIPDTQSEGLIDMVRFGRSCRSVLQKPVASGPSLLSAGSFPVQEPLPLDEDSIRSVLHRVSLHCELALYVAPLLPDGNLLNPVVRLCEHVVLVQSVSEQSVDVVQRIQLMQQARLHVAGVVLFEDAGVTPSQPQKWLPGSLYSGPASGAAAGAAAATTGAITPSPVTPPTASPTPEPEAAAADEARETETETQAEVTASPENAPSEAPRPQPPIPQPPVQEPPRQEPPAQEAPKPEATPKQATPEQATPSQAPPEEAPGSTPAGPPPEQADVPTPHIAWKGRKPEPFTLEDDDEGIPEIHLPDEAPSAGPFSSTRQPVASTPAETPPPTPPTDDAVAAATDQPLTGAEAIERLWSEPAEAPRQSPTPAGQEPEPPSPAGVEQQPFSEHPGSYAPGAEAYARGESEAVDIRMTEFNEPGYEDSETEFAYDDGNNWSRTPLYVLVTLLVLVGGAFGWALWTQRGIEQKVGEQLLDTDWIDAPQSTQGEAVPDDAAAMPQQDAALPSGGLKGVADATAQKGAGSPSEPPAASQAGADKQPAPTPTQPAATADKGATEEMAPVRVPESQGPARGDAVDQPPAAPPGRATPRRSPEPSPPTGAAAAMDANFTVHVGSFRHLEQAYKEIAVLQKRGYTGRAVRTDLGNKGIWYRVYVGGFDKRSEAEQVRDRILELPEYNYAQVKRLP